MSLKRIMQFWRSGFIVISIMTLLSVSGCSDISSKEVPVVDSEDEVRVQQQNTQENEEEIINICLHLYENAAEENKIADLEVVRSIVNQFGENGYPAVDSRNQIDMTETDQVINFCEIVDAKKEGELIIVEVTYTGSFVKYNLHTEDGIVDVVKSIYQYVNGDIQKSCTGKYIADYWNYTQEGYLMFSGVWFSEELYVLTLSGVEEYTAFRVQPLDEKCRELNRKYLIPIGFEQNNMFLVEWSEDDFGKLNFYDLYDILYSKLYKENVPYQPDDNLGVGAVYQIPKEDFESVIQNYFNISSETLQSKTIYDEENRTYEYKPRGFYEVEYPEYPYSEVIDFSENEDGTITLIANVVFPYAGDSKIYSHEVVVRPLEDGKVEYVSNHIITSEYHSEQTWHTPRLTEKEWEKIYGGLE